MPGGAIAIVDVLLSIDYQKWRSSSSQENVDSHIHQGVRSVKEPPTNVLPSSLIRRACPLFILKFKAAPQRGLNKASTLTADTHRPTGRAAWCRAPRQGTARAT
ncbi:hypothetical protein EVAR_32791_1 [Eumeta japonica]|uniref:Uncharacterized protein n=1 Tax=Eumeta variegata TaxID=151549 RepID=A0A4C1WCZ3_EUMVA|nr:hypothetical protein EVAR_32791_1 [Eumeta japonica]